MSSNRFLTPLLAALAVIGLVLPWRYNLAYFAAGGSVLPEVFFRDAFANALTSAITLDVYLSALAFSAGVATSSPSTALSTEMAGVITLSP